MFDFGAGMMMIFLIGGLIALIPIVFFILTIQKALERCSPENRTTSPVSAWFLLIPVFNFVWQFLLVMRVSESLHNEFSKRNLMEEPEPGKKLGLAGCICGLCGIIPVIGILASIAALVLWIMYWLKISDYSNKLVQPVLT